jgi:hypothetical protein
VSPSMNDLPYAAAGPGVASHRLGVDGFGAGEPALWRSLQLLWKWKLLVVAVPVLAAVAVALLLYVWPLRYTALLVYERRLSEQEYSVLLRRFYSRENLDRIIRHLDESGLAPYAHRLDLAQTQESFERLIRFDVAPMYPKRLQTTDPATSEQISAFQARLLSIRVVGRSAQEVSGASAVVTDNLETTLPLYDIRNDLKESIRKFKTQAAEIENSRFTLTLDLEKEQAKQEKLKSLGALPERADDGVVLQFTDVAKSREFLPLSYQIRAVESRIIDLQATLASDAEKYKYYLQVLSLNDKLLARVEEGLLADYTVPQFLGFLGEQLLACQDEAVADYLKSYIRRTENLAQVNTRAGEKPIVYPLAKYIVKNSVLTLVVFLMAAAFVAVLLEYRDARRRPETPER